jgi:hypothetical protein
MVPLLSLHTDPQQGRGRSRHRHSKRRGRGSRDKRRRRVLVGVAKRSVTTITVSQSSGVKFVQAKVYRQGLLPKRRDLPIRTRRRLDHSDTGNDDALWSRPERFER